ncbi:DedA family protein [Hafnia paralvei]|jgi:membrane protein DedA with SNARE-associated domain|uniref:Inner membrane protein YghB n=1 Tax=Hafnia paralvei TaxID=546367 RepID=A0A2A2MFP1_9GAMM|nr:DedA family protein [Hafnia paralvei]AMH18888.1 DedA family protein [Hafnia paralvei]KHS47207.1 membrane protein [Hafnia paralvei]PAV97437.1 DedA family protein [Hafnia paralvei]TBL51847.1 DedA family protein [Hafnia paralvei]TBL64471.1 DedA family protein [Hafnia paralvei]
MEVIKEILHALWAQDFTVLSDPKMIWAIYGILFTTLLLENGLLPAAFLPGDSLLLLAGALIAKGVLPFFPTISVLIIASSLGCWMSYIQGRWLGDTKLVQGWLVQLPAHYHQRAYHMFHKHGLVALLVGRFLAFVRTILPTIAGLSGLKNARFQVFNWLSALLWVCSVTGVGLAISYIPFVKRHEDQVMTCLMILPIILLVSGLVGTIVMVVRRKRQTTAQ